MSNPRDSQAELAQIYAQLTDVHYRSEIDNRVAIADERLKKISRWVRPGRLLDLGCSIGIFCGRAAAAGWKATGLDTSVWAIEQAGNEFPTVIFINGTIEEAIFPEDSFELVTLWDVLEHVTDPQAVLQKIIPWVVPGGWVMMNLPNCESLTARVMGKSWVLLLREHLWFFSPDTIDKLLSHNGFELTKCWSNWVRFSFSNILIRISQYKRMQRLYSLWKLPGFQRLGLHFPIGEMTVIGVKKVL